MLVRANIVPSADGAPILDGAVQIEDGRITAVDEWSQLAARAAQPGMEVVDHRAAWLVPGMIDLHVHLTLPGDGRPEHRFYAENSREMLFATAVANARSALAAGVTTMRDCGGMLELVLGARDAIDAGLIDGPRLIVAGPPVTITGGHCAYMGGEADGATGVQVLCRRLIKAGVDFIKLMASGGGTPGTQRFRTTYEVEEIRVARVEAHRARTHLAVHATNRDAVQRAMQAGADTVEHATLTNERTDTSFELELVDELAARGTFVSPTLQASVGYVRFLESEASAGRLDRSGVRELDARRSYLDCRIEQSVQMFKAGAAVASSTDAGWMINPFGEFVTGLEMVQDAGVSSREAFRAATEVPARALGRCDLGVIRDGAVADLVVINGNPQDDVRALRSVVAVYTGGIRRFAGDRVRHDPGHSEPGREPRARLTG